MAISFIQMARRRAPSALKRLLLKIVTLHPRSREPIGTGPIHICRCTYSMSEVRDYWVKIGPHEFGKTYGARFINRYYHAKCSLMARRGFKWKQVPTAIEAEIQPPWRT